MDRQQYEEAKTRLEEVTRKLRYEQMSLEERTRLEREGRELARIIVSPWIPYGWGYRIVMLAIAAVGFFGLAQGNHFLALAWLLLPLFSPRMVGAFLGKISGFKDL